MVISQESLVKNSPPTPLVTERSRKACGIATLRAQPLQELYAPLLSHSRLGILAVKSVDAIATQNLGK
ncbi:MAG: hypothetical protein V7K21_25010 [Nostoc sp.]|uniref:hypothetical protein n=1 Tax=Nostoc sp. TaxID=1180 RepID=UPI002FF9C7C6